MPNHQTLEHELERRSLLKEPDAEDFWHKYGNMKFYLNQYYYNWIQASCPYFTDHGEQHIRSVIDAASFLLSKQLNTSDSRSFSSLEIFLILCGAIWHDVGNVYGRSGHAQRVAEMTEKIKELGFPDMQIHRLVNEISKAHAGPEGLEIPRNEERATTANGTFSLYPRSLAAVVRFADEISENHTRVSAMLLPEIPQENQIFWQYANCIRACLPEPSRDRILIEIEILPEALMADFPCGDYPERSKGGNISLIDYILCRLEKPYRLHFRRP